jgi:hypothetical protein
MSSTENAGFLRPGQAGPSSRTGGCVQCGAITAQVGGLTPPEGGDGPNYQAT